MKLNTAVAAMMLECAQEIYPEGDCELSNACIVESSSLQDVSLVETCMQGLRVCALVLKEKEMPTL